jgi:hypothetical protein
MRVAFTKLAGEMSSKLEHVSFFHSVSFIYQTTSPMKEVVACAVIAGRDLFSVSHPTQMRYQKQVKNNRSNRMTWMCQGGI